IVLLPNQPQVAAFRQRLSLSGGGLGVTMSTFYALYAEVLAWAGTLEPRLPEPVQFVCIDVSFISLKLILPRSAKVAGG
ncbi:MAG: hypothetical protein HC804_10055, partial [Anaerolineae bacterium]|nr:hypothetical protein [Anaerolineae bacterium]